MGIQFYFTILVLIVIILHLGHHYSDSKEALPATQGYRPISVALHPGRTLSTRPSSAAFHCQDFEFTSFKGSCLPCPHPAQDGGADKDAVALQVLSTPEQDECSTLRAMRHYVEPLHRRALRAWSEADRDEQYHLDLCRVANRRNALGFYTTETQITEKDQKNTDTSQSARQRETRFHGASLRPTMECQSSCQQCSSSFLWLRLADSTAIAVSCQQAPKQRPDSFSSRDSADHCRNHRDQDHLQKYAPSSQEGGQCQGEVQGGKRSASQASSLLDDLRGGERQEMENIRRRLYQEGHCDGRRAQQSSRSPSRCASSPRHHQGAALEAGCRGARGDRDHIRWRSRRREHEGRHSRDDPKENPLSCRGPRTDPGESSRRQRGDAARSINKKAALGHICKTWIACTLAFPRAGQVDLQEACPRQNVQPCFQYMMTDIWNHSIITEEIFVNPWQASIRAVDLAHEIGTLHSCPAPLAAPCPKRHFAGQVQFSHHVDLYVGHENDIDMIEWPHALGVPHHHAYVLDHSSQPYLHSFGIQDDDEVSLLAAHVAQRDVHVQEQLQDQTTNEIMNDRNIARDFDDLSPASSTEESHDESDDLAMPENWYSTLLYTIEGGPTPVWLDWNDLFDMYKRAAQTLQIRHDDLYVMHWIQTPPQDTARANSASVIAHRRGDLPTGSQERFVLLDVEFHSALPLQRPEVVRKARLIPDQLSRNQVLRALGLHPFCQRASNRCLVWVNDELIPLGAPRIYVNDGDYMRIAVPPGSPYIEHIDTRCLATAFHQGMNIEEISMRHTLYRLGWHDDLVGPPHVPRQRGFHELADGDDALFLQLYADILAMPPLDRKPSFPIEAETSERCHEVPSDRIEDELPYMPDRSQSIVEPIEEPLQALQMQPAVIQELHMHWLAHFAQIAATDQPTNPTITVQTWFLAMPAHLHCGEPRPVQLNRHFETWFRTIAEAWFDLLDPHWHVHIHLVRPRPPATLLEREQRIHVIVVQRPPEDGAANLFTVLATHNVLEPMRHFARFAPLHVGKPQVIGFAGLSQDCYPERSPLQCMVWHGDLELRDRLALRNRNGISFLIIMQELPLPPPPSAPSAWDDEDDHMQFLQLPANVPTRRCQTVGLVAHTQRPSLKPETAVVHLDDAIPPPPIVKVDFACVQNLLLAINASTNEFQQEWPTELEIPQVTQEAITELVPTSSDVPTAFHFYTDGSKVPDGAVGAGIVLLIEYPHGLAFGGALCKTILLDGHASLGENGAVIWALLWAIH